MFREVDHVMESRCPLCRETRSRSLAARPHPGGSYRHCRRCDLIFATSGGLLSPRQEKERYLAHDNTHDNEGYVSMLSRFLERAVLPFSEPGRALDFGCGPGPVLADLLGDRGYQVEVYDPFFYPDRRPLGESYQLITCTEVVEHVTRAQETWALLFSLLSPGGVLAVMTHFHPGPGLFEDWWYHRDPTHIRFYSPQTFRYLSRHLGLETLDYDGQKTITLRRPQ